MFLGRVAGCVWATVKESRLEGQRLLIVQPLTPDLQNTGKRVALHRLHRRRRGRNRLLDPRQGGQLSVSAQGSSDGYDGGWHRGFGKHQQGTSGKIRSGPAPTRDASATTKPGRVTLMLIARVIGDLVSTQKHESHDGRKALLVQPMNLDGSIAAMPLIAFDAVDAGIGDRVLIVTEGFSAMTAVGRPNSPIDMAVIGFIDRIDLLPGEA